MEFQPTFFTLKIKVHLGDNDNILTVGWLENPNNGSTNPEPSILSPLPPTFTATTSPLRSLYRYIVVRSLSVIVGNSNTFSLLCTEECNVLWLSSAKCEVSSFCISA